MSVFLCSCLSELSARDWEMAKEPSFQTGKSGWDFRIPETDLRNRALRIAFRFPESRIRNPKLTLRTESGKERLDFTMQAEREVLDCGKEIGAYFYNGYAERSFAWPENILGWSEFASKQQYIPGKERCFLLDLIPSQDGIRIFLDGMFLQTWNPKSAIRISGAADAVRMARPEYRTLPESNPLFEPLDLSFRRNSDAVGKEKIRKKSLPLGWITAGAEQIPFFLPDPEQATHLDLSASWVREGNLQGAYPGNRGTFGGRWGGAMTRNPMRLQFRIPNRQYHAVYLLAAAEDSPERIRSFTVQFYRPGSGFPKNFVSGEIPLFSAKANETDSFEVKTTDGKLRRIHLVKVDVEPGKLQEFSDLPYLEMELTKQVQPYRCYPDPVYYSMHGAGIPSGVHVFAVTLGARPVELALDPVHYANVFPEGENAAYRIRLKNLTRETQTETLKLALESFDRSRREQTERTVVLNPMETKELTLSLPLKQFGWHAVTLTSGKDCFRRSLVHLRKRGDKGIFRDLEEPGHLFGTWPSGGHGTPSGEIGMRLMAMAGAKATVDSLKKQNVPNAEFCSRKPLADVMREFGVRSYTAFGFIDFRYTGFDFPRPEFNVTFDAAKKEEMRSALLKKLKELEQKTPGITQNRLVRIFGEPGGIGENRIFAEYSGAPVHPLSPAELARFQLYCRKLKLSGDLIREHYPHMKILMPHGDPLFAIPFLREPELNPLIDGVALDYGVFDRLPEMQIHQCAMQRTYLLAEEWKKYKKDRKPFFGTFEGPCFGPVTEGSLTARESAAYLLRAALLLSGYGVRHQFTAGGVFEPASWYGEQHYAGGHISRPGGLNPYPSYAVFATMTRHLGKRMFDAYLPTPSTSAFHCRFTDERKQNPLHVFWVLRGTRSLVFDRDVTWFDAMDNEHLLKRGESLTVSDLPLFVTGDASAAWGPAEHPDSIRMKETVPLGEMKNGWKQVQEPETLYTDSNPEFIQRYPAEMQTGKTPEGLAVRLGTQKTNRGIMPFFTAFRPSEPIRIPGRARYLTMRVKGTSDWGRIVYVLRDADGRKWVSVGMKKAWNCDDTQSQSSLNFDGWRLVRMELPAHAPYDNYRENGTTWWGCDDGNAVVKLPLQVEKVLLERRAQVLYGNSLVPASTAPVVLGELFAEYSSPGDRLRNPENLPRMPEPPSGEIRNPIRELADSAQLPPLAVTAAEQPPTQYDGTNGIFHFQTKKELISYDVYLSRHADGSGAIRLANRLKKSPAPVRGFLPDTEFHAFVIGYDKQGRHTAPAAGFRFQLADQFGMK